jgi:hypothetical protein
MDELCLPGEKIIDIVPRKIFKRAKFIWYTSTGDKGLQNAENICGFVNL